MPVSRRRIKSRTKQKSGPRHTGAQGARVQPHNQSLMMLYAQNAERNMTAFIQELKRAIRTRQHLPDIHEGILITTRIAEQYGDLTDWMETTPEAAWLSRESESLQNRG